MQESITTSIVQKLQEEHPDMSFSDDVSENADVTVLVTNDRLIQTRKKVHGYQNNVLVDDGKDRFIDVRFIIDSHSLDNFTPVYETLKKFSEPIPPLYDTPWKGIDKRILRLHGILEKTSENSLTVTLEIRK